MVINVNSSLFTPEHSGLITQQIIINIVVIFVDVVVVVDVFAIVVEEILQMIVVAIAVVFLLVIVDLNSHLPELSSKLV